MLRLLGLALVYFSFATTRANPIQGIFDPACFVVTGDCPNKNVSFWLFTNATRDKPKLLDPLNLNPWDFSPPLPVKILIHGYTGYRDFAPSSYIRPALLDHDDVYVISIDYGPLVRAPCYYKAVQNLPLVSKCLAQLINNLIDRGIVQNEQIHVIGFSLGGQVAGQTANYVKRKLKRITGLDPAKPLFILAGNDRRLDANDAEYVDVIHTDVLGRGMLGSMGHVDFYPNIGAVQPGCLEENREDPGSCNHDRAPRFYAESIRSDMGFWGNGCNSWLHYMFDLCPSNSTTALMGYHIDTNTRGSFFLSTAAKSPFALGQPPDLVSQAALLKFNLLDPDQELSNNFEPQLQRAFISEAKEDF